MPKIRSTVGIAFPIDFLVSYFRWINGNMHFYLSYVGRFFLRLLATALSIEFKQFDSYTSVNHSNERLSLLKKYRVILNISCLIIKLSSLWTALRQRPQGIRRYNNFHCWVVRSCICLSASAQNKANIQLAGSFIIISSLEMHIKRNFMQRSKT